MAKLKRRVSLFQSGTRTVWSSALAIVISLAAIGAAGVHLPARAAFGSARGAADVGRGLMSPAKSARQTSPEQFVNCINAQGKVVWTLDLPAGALSPNGKIVARRLGAGSYPAGVAAGSVCRVLPSSVDFRTPALILSPGGQQIPALLVGVDLKGNWVNPASGGSDYSDARITQTGIIGLNPSGPPVGGYQTLPKPPTPVQTRLGILSIAHATWKSDQKLKAYGYPVLGFGDELTAAFDNTQQPLWGCQSGVVYAGGTSSITVRGVGKVLSYSSPASSNVKVTVSQNDSSVTWTSTNQPQPPPCASATGTDGNLPAGGYTVLSKRDFPSDLGWDQISATTHNVQGVGGASLPVGVSNCTCDFNAGPATNTASVGQHLSFSGHRWNGSVDVTFGDRYAGTLGNTFGGSFVVPAVFVNLGVFGQATQPGKHQVWSRSWVIVGPNRKISGQILANCGTACVKPEPVAGFPVNARQLGGAGSGTTETSATGTYTLDVPQGSYTVAPGMGGTFSPSGRTVDATHNAHGVDFTGCPGSLARRLPRSRYNPIHRIRGQFAGSLRLQLLSCRRSQFPKHRHDHGRNNQ